MSNSAEETTAFATSISMYGVHESHNGGLQETLSDALLVIMQDDYGADRAALCDDHRKQLAKANAFVPMLPMEEPISIKFAVEGKEDPLSITADRKSRNF